MRFQSDIPERVPLGRTAAVRARVNASTYVLDFGPGAESSSDLGLYSGSVKLGRGEQVWASWSDESGAWLIRAVNTTSRSSSPPTSPTPGEEVRAFDSPYSVPSGIAI